MMVGLVDFVTIDAFGITRNQHIQQQKQHYRHPNRPPPISTILSHSPPPPTERGTDSKTFPFCVCWSAWVCARGCVQCFAMADSLIHCTRVNVCRHIAQKHLCIYIYT